MVSRYSQTTATARYNASEVGGDDELKKEDALEGESQRGRGDSDLLHLQGSIKIRS